MKKETAAQKLLALLGQVAPEIHEVAKESNAKQGKIHGITEDEIQQFRVAQGIIYFLQAPELFQSKICKHCGAHYLVSRLYVAFCSYTCIKKELAAVGIDWKKGDDLELLVKNVYEGNEPIWIRSPEMLQRCLLKIQEGLTSDQSLSVNQSQKEESGSLILKTKEELQKL